MHIVTAQNRFLFILLVLCSLQFSVFAKPKNKGVQFTNVAEADPDIDTNQSRDIEWQVLEWDEEEPEYVYKYDITIEQLNPKTEQWKLVNTLSTEGNETRIQVKPYLFPGVYRFKVVTYDLFGFPSVESDWYNFNVYEAFMPDVKDASLDLTKSRTMFLDEFNNGIFNISGKNLFDLPEGKTDINFTEYFIVPVNKRGKGYIEADVLEHDDKNSKLKLSFPLSSLDTGVYHIVARDASGLENDRTDSNEITVKFKKAVDFDVSGGYAFPVVILDGTLPQYMNSRVFPMSATAKANFMFYKNSWGYLGTGVSGFYSFNVAPTEEYTIMGNTISGFANIVFQKPFYSALNPETGKRNHIANLELRAGGGVTMLYNYQFLFPHNVTTKGFNKYLYGFDAGVSGQWYISTRLFLEGNLDYTMVFGEDIMIGMLIPSISIGWQF